MIIAKCNSQRFQDVLFSNFSLKSFAKYLDKNEMKKKNGRKNKLQNV